MSRSGRRAPVFAGLGLALLIIGCGGSSEPMLLTGRADAAENAISISTDGWTYSVPLDGVAWEDEAGRRHEGGRPACLEPGASRQIDFAAVEVTVEDSTWRPVVWVSCR